MVVHLPTFFNRLGVQVRQWFAPPAPPDVPLGPFDAPRPLPLAQPLDAPLPAWVAACPVAQRYRTLLAALPWDQFPERPTDRPWPGPTPVPRAPFVAAYLVKLVEQKRYMSNLRGYLLEHPALVWLLGFPLVSANPNPCGFNLAKTVPTRRQFNRVLRELDNAQLQFLLGATVDAIREALPQELAASFGDVIAIDTKHILAWVVENNPKAYVPERHDPNRRPTGDRDCTLGCKRRHNRSPEAESAAADAARAAPPTAPSAPAAGAAPPTPTTNPTPASQRVDTGEWYWGYASGVAATIVKGWGEVVLAERTRPFHEGDLRYYAPLMETTIARLGRHPRYGAFDAAFDAHYVYAAFHTAGGFAAVPRVDNLRQPIRQFSADGTPCCAAGLAMTLQFTYQSNTGLVPHPKERFRCPLQFPQPSGAPCPVQDRHFTTGGCKTDLAAGVGSRLRWQLDRDGDAYKAIYKQRTVTERVNSQAKELGIERPYLRNQRSITNQDTLIYILINLQVLHRIRRKEPLPPEEVGPATTADALAA